MHLVQSQTINLPVTVSAYLTNRATIKIRRCDLFRYQITALTIILYTVMALLPSQPINITTTHTSLFTAMDVLASFPYDAGLVLGCINEAAECFIAVFVCNYHLPLQFQHDTYIAKSIATQYLHDIHSLNSPIACPLDTLFDIDELITLVQKVHESWLIDTRLSLPAIPSLSNDTEKHLKAVHTLFRETLYTAVVQHLYNGNTEHQDYKSFREGWFHGKSLHAG
jgi:hypothetical protein